MLPSVEDAAVSPATAPDDGLGRRVARFRQIRGMSLRTLAARAGVSSSFISQLENGRTNASIASLRRIAGALGVTPAQLLDDAAAHTRGVLRARQRPQLPLDGATKYVFSLPPLRNFEVYGGSFEPGGSTGRDAYSHGEAQEMIVVSQGSITLELDGERYEMNQDDSIEFLSSVPHRLVNESAATASVLWIISAPTSGEAPIVVPSS